MPIPKAQEVTLSEGERQRLEKLVKRHQVGQQIALRARNVLAAADGLKNKEIVEKDEVTGVTIGLWRNRWVKLQSILLDDLSIEERLQDAPLPGAPAGITAEQCGRIEALACEKPEASERPIREWRAHEMTDEVKRRHIVEEILARHAARLLIKRLKSSRI